MAGEDRLEDNRLTFRQSITRQPWDYDFYLALRRAESLHPAMPRLGEARRPADEPVRLGQRPDLAFAPATISDAEVGRDGRLRMSVCFLGVWGPQGPLPVHLTEFARERARNYGDPTLVRFADVFHHRMLLLFYRAWRQAQPTASRDRPGVDRFRTYVGALFGQGSPAWFGRAAVADDSKRYFSGALARSARHADGLADILAGYFGVPVSIESFAQQWMNLPPTQRSALGAAGGGSALGSGVVLGKRVLDAQHHFCVHVGPMTLANYERCLPGAPWNAKLRDWIREYVGEEYGVHALPTITAAQVPKVELGKSGRLGWTTWLGPWRSHEAARGARLMLTQVAH